MSGVKDNVLPQSCRRGRPAQIATVKRVPHFGEQEMAFTLVYKSELITRCWRRYLSNVRASELERRYALQRETLSAVSTATVD
jgi:hypothetical protein